VHGRRASAAFDANDPKRSLAGMKSRSAAISCRTIWAIVGVGRKSPAVAHSLWRELPNETTRVHQRRLKRDPDCLAGAVDRGSDADLRIALKNRYVSSPVQISDEDPIRVQAEQ
jgi:hypothetical protein